MQEWPPEVETFLKTMHMPSGDVVGLDRHASDILRLW